MQEITLQISVKTNTSSSAEEIAAIIQRLIDIGLADASATAMSGEGDVDEAEKATDLNISAPVAVKMPRVLVVVSGGVADPVYDAGVDVEVFDWDNYNDEEDYAKTGVPAHFADLAEPIDVPVAPGSLAQNAEGEADTVNTCSECGSHPEKIIGCPDGAEVCQECFDAGVH